MLKVCQCLRERERSGAAAGAAAAARRRRLLVVFAREKQHAAPVALGDLPVELVVLLLEGGALGRERVQLEREGALFGGALLQREVGTVGLGDERLQPVLQRRVLRSQRGQRLVPGLELQLQLVELGA